MKLTFLGSGAAFSKLKDNFHSNMVLESETGKRLLIDCGSDARHSTEALNLKSRDFDAVYISHLHADHAGGLEWLAFTTKFNPAAIKPKLMVHPSMRQMLWDHVLCGGLESIEDVVCTLETYFEIYPIKKDDFFNWEGIEFEMVKTLHVLHDHHPVPSFGLFFKNHKTKVFITTDTQFSPDLYMKYYQEADIIFHDCEVSERKSCVHPSYEDLSSLPLDIKKKIWLYHYSADKLPNPVEQGFQGFVKRGQAFEL